MMFPEHCSVPRTPQNGYWNLTNPYTKFRWKYPNFYQMPGIVESPQRSRHRDGMQRVWNGVRDDRYLSPMDAHLAKLVVQATDSVYTGNRNSTWRRTFIRDVSPIYMQIANWPFAGLPVDPAEWESGDFGMACLKWIPACAGLLFLLITNPTGSAGQVRNSGCFDPFPYRLWGYPKVSRNPHENRTTIPPPPDRILGPRYLCFLQGSGISLELVNESNNDVPYVFVSYTAIHFDRENKGDLDALVLIGERAAKDAGVPAFWLASSCMSPKHLEDDVYRISDVIRGAHSLAIVVGTKGQEHAQSSTENLLRQWGTRLWTLPEVLLSPTNRDIKVYTRGFQGDPWSISIKQFADVVWADKLISRQLVDHYVGTLNLGRLELTSIALRCLHNRQWGGHFPGDLSYALMGLLRQRPQVDRTDTEFQAFARMSLANDSDMLLERLICLLPEDRHAPWLAMDSTDDAFGTSLWDIYPRCQISGVGESDTVILDGAFGAAIRWKAFAPVAYVRIESWKRLFSRLSVHGSPLIFSAGIFLTTQKGSLNAAGAVLLIFSLLVILASPYLVRIINSGKLWNTQAWFFGFEGYLDIATIEANIFGANMGRLRWSPAGSTLSRHLENRYGECRGVDPTTDPRIRDKVNGSPTANFGDMRIFTLVDTFTLTVTMFEAVRPPVAVLVCGHEGGMQRALLCSYDWATQTLYRETVLRMETPVLERMFRVPRFRFGLTRPIPSVAPSTEV